MTEAQCRADFAPYINKWGMVSTSPGGVSGNDLLYTSEYIVLLSKHGWLTPQDVTWFLSALKSCEVAPGVYRRNPENTDCEAMDDYTGIALALKLCGAKGELARILTCGQTGARVWGPVRVGFAYNPVKPGTLERADGTRNWSAWQGRDPAFRAHIYHCSGQSAPAPWQLAWAASVAWSGKPQDQDPWVFNWLLVEGATGQGGVCAAAAAHWRGRLKAAWPGGIGQVLARYFGFEHPLATWWP